MSNLISYLFETNAVKICPDNKPFFYTSGKIGPYFINTHFLYGSENDAVDLLNFIDNLKNEKKELPAKILEKTFEQYNKNKIYKNVIDEMINSINRNINLDDIDYISGGERRDWFFSNIIAHLLNKPHITLFKDNSTVVSNFDFSKTEEMKDLNNAKVLHIADLVTEASSYVRMWIPSVKSLNATICWSQVVVDRMQGGDEVFRKYNIKDFALIQINPSLFSESLNKGLINENQKKMLDDFYNNPYDTMRDFLISHPKFIEESLKSTDTKTSTRVKLLLENDPYNLKH